VYRLLPKVTERHIKPSGQDTMKVSLAAQVMSLTVAEAINTLVTVGKDNCTELERYIGLSVVMLCGATIMYLFYFMELSCHVSLFQYNGRLHGQQVSINSCVSEGN